MRASPHRKLGFALIGAGLTCMAVYAASAHQAEVHRIEAVAAFHAALPSAPVVATNAQPPASQRRLEQALDWIEHARTADTTDWSPGRIEAWRELIEAPPLEPIALLEIPALELAVPVYAGADETQLDLGVGHIDGTTPIGHSGNIGLSSHRDGYFRGLRHIQPGHRVRLQDPSGRSWEYEVTATQVVDPEETHVLYPQGDDRLTLVTCYPFYFVGHAPQRYIVAARRVDVAAPRG